MRTKRLISLFVLIVSVFCLLTGCTVNIHVGTPTGNATPETDSQTVLDSGEKTPMYEARAMILISNTPATDTAISSSDLIVSKQLMESYVIILQSDTVQGQIRAKYPDAEYALSLESINEATIFTLIATSNNPEYLEEICNMAASLLCEKIPQVVAGTSCKAVSFAYSSKLVE